MKFKGIHDGKEHTKVGVYEAIKNMIVENGGNPEKKEESSVRKQREFYERVATFVNKEDFRSSFEPLHKYEMTHWIRSRWVLHDLKLEESRQIRCEWYQEHTEWGNNLDQLSFAYVMAKREMERKIARDEPDDRLKASMPTHPELHQMTDADEWHPIMGGRESAQYDKDLFMKVPDHMMSKDNDEENSDPEETEIDKAKHDVQLFVRIMSDKLMVLSRKVWVDTQKMMRKKHKKKKK
jgi:hypothetical protein